ncbi:MAG TPA: urease subunit gamma [Nitrososphaeraceae archaeon]|nr:urease subunit gamma [Nitrososphaeraceae archaeon]
MTVTVQGEPDTAPFTRIYQFYNKTDYIILSNSIKTINNKLSRKMKININETLYIYLNYIIDQLRSHKKRNEIIKNASKLLTPDQVMIGVPESLRKINFNIKLMSTQRLRITIKEPISTTSYILAP